MHFEGVSNLNKLTISSPAIPQDTKAKMEILKKLTPSQRKALPPEDIIFFYKNYPQQDIQINPSHLAETFKRIPPLPEIKSDTKASSLITLFDDLNKKHPDLVNEIVTVDFEIKNIKLWREGLEELVKASEKAKAKAKKKMSEAGALDSLIVNILDLVRDMPPFQVLEYLRDMAVGGHNCPTGKFTQTYKVYTKVLHLDSIENKVFKILHDVRDNIVDLITAVRSREDSDESVEERSNVLVMYSRDFGVLSLIDQKEIDEQNLIIEKFRDPQQLSTYLEGLKQDGATPYILARMVQDIKEKLDGQGPTRTLFYAHYTPAMILDLFRVSKEIHQYYLDDTDQSKDYLFDHVIASGFLIKDEYIYLMLDNLGVLSFN